MTFFYCVMTIQWLTNLSETSLLSERKSLVMVSLWQLDSTCLLQRSRSLSVSRVASWTHMKEHIAIMLPWLSISAGWYFDIIKIMRYGKKIEYPIIISWLSWYIAETRYDPKYCWLWKINHDSLTKSAALYCFKPIQNFTSRCPNICLSWTCTRRQARASLQPKNRLNFIHQKSNFQLDISIYCVINNILLMIIDKHSNQISPTTIIYMAIAWPTKVPKYR